MIDLRIFDLSEHSQPVTLRIRPVTSRLECRHSHYVVDDLKKLQHRVSLLGSGYTEIMATILLDAQTSIMLDRIT